MCCCTVQCSLPDANASVVDDSVFGRVWKQNLSVPLFLILVLFPLVNFKSPTFFTKLNALGMFNMCFYIMCSMINQSMISLISPNDITHWMLQIKKCTCNSHNIMFEQVNNNSCRVIV